MQTKRKQTLLAGAGLLTALTLSVAGCTPSKFTPGVTAPTGPNAPAQGTTTTPAAQAVTLDLAAQLGGAPLANADVRVYNALTGAPALITNGVANVIAVGGGNLKATAAVAGKTDASGNFALNVSGLTGNNVAKVVVTSGGKSVTTLIDSTGNLAGAGFAVAQAGARVKVTADEVTTVQTAIASEVLKLINSFKNDETRGSSIKELVKDLKAMAAGIKQELADNPEAAKAVTENVTLSGEVEKPEIVSDFLVDAELTDEITSAVQEVAKALAAAAAANALLDTPVEITSTNFVGLDVAVKLDDSGNLSVGDVSVDLSDNVTTEPAKPTESEAPIIELPPEVPAEEEKARGVWSGFTPDITIGTTSVTVEQPAGDSQYTFMELLIPTAHLTGYTTVAAFESALTGNVMGTNTTGANRSGTLDFVGGDILLGATTIGTYSITQEGETLKVTLTYDANDAIQTVGNHTTTISCPGVSLSSQTDMYVSLSRADGEGTYTTF